MRAALGKSFRIIEHKRHLAGLLKSCKWTLSYSVMQDVLCSMRTFRERGHSLWMTLGSKAWWWWDHWNLWRRELKQTDTVSCSDRATVNTVNYSSGLVNKISLQNILTRKIFTSASHRSQQAWGLILSSSKMRDKMLLLKGWCSVTREWGHGKELHDSNGIWP